MFSNMEEFSNAIFIVCIVQVEFQLFIWVELNLIRHRLFDVTGGGKPILKESEQGGKDGNNE